jgi:hypothetical protein
VAVRSQRRPRRGGADVLVRITHHQLSTKPLILLSPFGGHTRAQKRGRAAADVVLAPAQCGPPSENNSTLVGVGVGVGVGGLRWFSVAVFFIMGACLTLSLFSAAHEHLEGQGNWQAQLPCACILTQHHLHHQLPQSLHQCIQ